MNIQIARPVAGLWAAAGLMLAACSPNGQDPDAGTSEAGIEAEMHAEMTMPEQRSPNELEHFTRLAAEHLRDRLGPEAEEISVERAEKVTWRSGALGCPEPDMMYTQALVPGYRIVLGAGKQHYHYHGAEGHAPFPCPQERAESPLERDQSEM